MEKNLRVINVIVKVDQANKDTRGLVIEAKEMLQSSPHFDNWTAISFEYKGLEINVFRDSDVDDIVRWVEMSSPEHAPTPLTARQPTRYMYLGEEYIPYICISQHSTLLNPN